MNLTDFPIVHDLFWGQALTSRPARGIYDYARLIKFERELTPDEVQAVCKILQADPRCPGYTGVHGQLVKDNTYKFTTTWDSSD